MANKTKAELYDEIEQKNEELRKIRNDIERLKKYEQYDEMADDVKAIHDSFIRAGFDDAQAFTLLEHCIKAAGNINATKRSF